MGWEHTEALQERGLGWEHTEAFQEGGLGWEHTEAGVDWRQRFEGQARSHHLRSMWGRQARDYYGFHYTNLIIIIL